MKTPQIIKNRPPKPHDFKLNLSKSEEKGKMFKTSNGLYRVGTENRYVYHCARCDSTIEVPKKMQAKSLDIQVAVRYTCV